MVPAGAKGYQDPPVPGTPGSPRRHACPDPPGACPQQEHLRVSPRRLRHRGWGGMIPDRFEYFVPKTGPEVICPLQRYGPEAKLLAGGHSLIPLMKLRLAAPRYLVDLNRIPRLAYIEEDGAALPIGPLPRHGDLEASDLVRARYPLLADAARVIADPLVRNMGTIGGAGGAAAPAGGGGGGGGGGAGRAGGAGPWGTGGGRLGNRGAALPGAEAGRGGSPGTEPRRCRHRSGRRGG